MKRVTLALLTLALAASPSGPAAGADDTKVREGTNRVESGASKTGEGIKETAKGIGTTVTEGAKYTGEKLKESGRAAEPQARSAWQNLKEGATNAGHSVQNFFARLFGD
jgi:hypothetical protein